VAVAGLAVYAMACAALGGLCLQLALVPLVPLALYSFLKRFTVLCHFGIGVCMALAPLGAFVAASGTLEFALPVRLLALFAFLWISGFDIIYALQDIDSDRATGVRSLPAAVGSSGAQWVAGGAHLLAAAVLTHLWWLLGRGVIPGTALALALGALALAYWQRLPLRVRFFPVSALAGMAGALVPLLGGLP
jgi:4-hydroxybenzoate polyprenyltransferase